MLMLGNDGLVRVNPGCRWRVPLCGLGVVFYIVHGVSTPCLGRGFPIVEDPVHSFGDSKRDDWSLESKIISALGLGKGITSSEWLMGLSERGELQCWASPILL